MALGFFDKLPIQLLPNICRDLSIQDVLSFSETNERIANAIEHIVFPEIFKIRISIDENNDANVEFTNRVSKRASSLRINDSMDWQRVIQKCRRVKCVELDIAKGASTSQVFGVFRKSEFRLKSLVVKIREGQRKSSVEKINRLHNNCIALVSQHCASLESLEASTSDTQRVHVDIDARRGRMRLEYVQPRNDEENGRNHSLAYNMFHSLLENRPSSNVTLEIDPSYDANVALQRAFQIAIPHSNRRNLKHLTIEFGNSLQSLAAEQEIKSVLQRHVDEFHFTTPNLQHFTCNLPHTLIDVSLECLNEQIRDQVQKSRRSTTPYVSSIVRRPAAVPCK